MTMNNEELANYYEKLPAQGGYDSLCKMTVPNNLAGRAALDLACRRGKGAYKLSAEVGKRGSVLGIDWREDCIEAARDGVARALEKSGLTESNMGFALAFPEDLAAAGVESNSIDIVYVNSVFNLFADPKAALTEIVRVLKPGGLLVLQTVIAATPRDSEVVSAAREIGNAVQAAPHRKTLAGWLMSAGFDMMTFSNGDEEPIAPDTGVDAATKAPVVETDERASFNTTLIHVEKPDGVDHYREYTRKDINQFR